MTKAREIMTKDAEYLMSDDTVQQAASLLATTGIGSLPVCDPNGQLRGMITDRDIVVRVVATSLDPESVRLADVVEPTEVAIVGADDPVERAIEIMKSRQVRRVPVVDDREVVGIISQGDVARNLTAQLAGELLAGISA
jgi:CBS domain-containing protein